jgi:RNA polymerase sigma factor (sigma-70 family)
MEKDQGGHGDQHGADLVQLWVKKERPLMRYARRLIERGGSEFMDADELFQITFFDLFTKPRSSEGVRNPVSYLFRILHNRWADEVKKANKANKIARTVSLEAIQDDPARRNQLPAIEPEVVRNERDEELRQKEVELWRGWEKVQSRLTDEEKELLGAWLEEPKLKQYAAKQGKNLYEVRANWYKLRGKLNRLAKAQGLASARQGGSEVASVNKSGVRKARPTYLEGETDK